MLKINFTKMHGTGNDFVVIDCHSISGVDFSALAGSICQRRFGAGADQMILIFPSDSADYRMDIYNPDGSRVEMCGNALRAVALYCRERLDDQREEISIETLGGTAKASIADGLVTVNMGPPSFDPERIGLNSDSELIDKTYSFSDDIERRVTCVSMGNPHAVTFVDDTNDCDFETVGPLIENHPLFKNRTNVEFIQLVSPEELIMRVWERGTGETLACGSGAAASCAAAIATGRSERRVKIRLKGGDLTLEWKEEDNCIYKTGPAAFVYDGVWGYEG